jgi:arginase
MLFVPYFIGERSRDAARLGPAEYVEPALPASPPMDRVAVLYADLAQRVASGGESRVQAGDCMATLGVAAGLQQSGIDPHLIWLDAHGDFNTWDTTPSGFLGGMPLAMMVGLGEQTVVEAVGLRPLAADRVWLVGARDLDPGERDNLARARIRQLEVDELARADLPEGPLYVHFDVDLLDPGEMPALDFPAPGGPTSAEVRQALDHVFAEGSVAGFSFVGWNPDFSDAERARALARELVRDLLLS